MNKWYSTNQDVYLFQAYNFDRNVKHPNNYLPVFRAWYGNMVLFPLKKGDNFSEVVKKACTPITTGKVFYFSKESKFPRYKLAGTEYKRCIKPEKADYIVLPELEPCNFVCTNKVFRLYEDDCKKSYLIDKEEYLKGFIDEASFIAQIRQFGRVSLTFVQEMDSVGRVEKKNTCWIDVYNNQFTKPIITDNMLDIKLSQTFPTMTENDVEQIDTMLASEDKSVRELGLKMLTGFNIFETPTLIKVLLFKNINKISCLLSKGGVGIHKMLNGIDFPRGGYVPPFPSWVSLIVTKEDKYSDFEAQEIRKLLVPLYKESAERAMFSVHVADNCPFVPKITITVE